MTPHKAIRPSASHGCVCARGEREHLPRQDIAAVEVDEARGEFVDHRPAGRNVRDLERGADGPDDRYGRAAHELHRHEKDRQLIDEPQRAEWIDQRQQIKPYDFARAAFGRECSAP